MKHVRSLISLALASALCLTMLTACGNADETTSSQQPSASEPAASDGTTYADTIVFSMTSTPTGTFFLNFGVPDYSGGISWMVHAPMLVPDASGELESYLAESYEVSEDGTVYTFHLHENAMWNDGEPVTADDVAFTFMQLADPTNDGLLADSALYIKGVQAYRDGTADTVEGLRVIDEHTIEITLEQYYSKGLAFIGQAQIYPKHIWEGIPYSEIENQDREMLDYPVGCGPYKVVEFVQGEYVRLEANEDFFLGAPLTKNIVVKVVNSDSVSAELMSGSIDIADVTNLTSDELTTLEGQGFDIANCYYDLFQTMSFNYEKMDYPLELRKAVQYAIDRQGIVDSLLEGRGIVSNMLITAASWAYPTEVQGVEQNLDKAKEYLAQAGYVDVDGDGYVEDPDGQPFSMEILYPTGLKVREQSAVVFQENLAAIGIKVELTTAADFSALFEIQAENHHDLFLMGYGVDSVDPDPSTYVTESYGFDEEAISLVAQAAATPDEDTRKELYAQVAQIIQDEAPILCLYNQERAYAYPSGLINYEPSTFNQYYNIHKWAIPVQ
mgnify:CR=1 FL=1